MFIRLHTYYDSILYLGTKPRPYERALYHNLSQNEKYLFCRINANFSCMSLDFKRVQHDFCSRRGSHSISDSFKVIGLLKIVAYHLQNRSFAFQTFHCAFALSVSPLSKQNINVNQLSKASPITARMAYYYIALQKKQKHWLESNWQPVNVVRIMKSCTVKYAHLRKVA